MSLIKKVKFKKDGKLYEVTYISRVTMMVVACAIHVLVMLYCFYPWFAEQESKGIYLSIFFSIIYAPLMTLVITKCGIYEQLNLLRTETIKRKKHYYSKVEPMHLLNETVEAAKKITVDQRLRSDVDALSYDIEIVGEDAKLELQDEEDDNADQYKHWFGNGGWN